MTRTQLVKKLSLRMNVTKKEAELYLTAFLDAIMETLHKDGRVVVQGFGSFRLGTYKARVAKKPLTGELIDLPERHKPKFHAGKELKELVNAEMKQEEKLEAAIDQLRLTEPSIAIQLR